jgi:hypothetical protein
MIKEIVPMEEMIEWGKKYEAIQYATDGVNGKIRALSHLQQLIGDALSLLELLRENERVRFSLYQYHEIIKS